MLFCQEDYEVQLLKIRKLSCSKQAKVQLLKGLVQQLRAKVSSYGALEENKKCKTLTTDETVFSEAQVDLAQVIAEVQKKIILKRDVKIQLNQQIEEAQQQCEAIEKTVYLKQQMDDELKRKIDFKMFEIQMNNYQQKQKQKQKQSAKNNKNNKTFSIFSRKVLDFFN